MNILWLAGQWLAWQEIIARYIVHVGCSAVPSWGPEQLEPQHQCMIHHYLWYSLIFLAHYKQSTWHQEDNSSDYKPVTINSDAVLQKADAYKSHHLKHKMLAT